MIAVLTDIIQSFTILFWAVVMVFLIRRVNRLESRRPQETIYRLLPDAQDPQPVCGCGHHQCFHDENGCANIDARNYVHRNEVERYPVPCGCKRYTGPEPLPTVIP